MRRVHAFDRMPVLVGTKGTELQDRADQQPERRLLPGLVEGRLVRLDLDAAKPGHAEKLVIAVRDAKSAAAARKGIGQGDALGQGMSFMRDLANLPGNVCYNWASEKKT